MSGPTFEVFTLFPDAIAGFLRGGLIGKAAQQGRVAVHCTDYREFATDRHRTVDDAPYGGGPGMVMKIEPVVAALEAVTAARGPMHRILLTPSAPRFDQRAARRLAGLPRIALLCGRYEGIDDRVREAYTDECLSLGDFVLNGGEVAALAIIEAVARLCEGVLGNPESAAHDSFSGPGADLAVSAEMSSRTGVSRAPSEVSQGADEMLRETDEGGPADTGAWLEFPQYTRPPEFRGLGVPAVLLAGAHGDVARWRAEQAWRRTWALRPDLRPRRRLPAETAVYVALAPGDLTCAESCARLGAAGVFAVGDEVQAPGAAHCRDFKELRRVLRRRHGRAPSMIAVTTAPVPDGPLPVARSVAALLDLLALTGDLSEPLVLVPVTTASSLGDLTPAPPNSGTASQSPLRQPVDVFAVFALDLRRTQEDAIGLARTPSMIDSSPPQPVCGTAFSIAAAALRELCSPAARQLLRRPPAPRPS